MLRRRRGGLRLESELSLVISCLRRAKYYMFFIQKLKRLIQFIRFPFAYTWIREVTDSINWLSSRQGTMLHNMNV